MNIAIVCYPTFGGSGVVATELGIALSNKGHKVHFVTYEQPVRLEALSAKLHFHEVHVPQYPLFRYQPYELALSSRLVDVVKTHNIDVLHVHYAIPHAYAAYMAKKMLADQGIFVPIVTTLHGTDITLVGSHPFYKSAVTFSINHSDCVTAVSENLKSDTRSLFEIKKDIKVIPNFIDIDKYIDKPIPCEASLLVEKNEKIITHISNFRPLKRIMDILYVFERVAKEIPAKLMMVGEGPEKKKAQSYIKKKGLSDKVMFLGKSNEIDKILCHSDLFILPSEKESFGLSALEAMVNRVPVISTNIGGLPEVNKDGFSGFLHDLGDIDGMTQSALGLLKNPEKLKRFKQQAFENAIQFDLKKIVISYEDVYRNAVSSQTNQ